MPRQSGFAAPAASGARLWYQATCIGLCLLAFCGATAADQYKTFDPPGSTCTSAEAVNRSQTVAGYYFDGSYHGFARTPDGTLSEFDPQGSIQTFASSIDSKGVITGSFDYSDGQTHGFLRSPRGKITVFDPPESITTAPASISKGTIAGTYYLSNGLILGFVRARAGTFAVFDVPNWYATFPYAVNAKGETTGDAWDGDTIFQPFVRTADGMITTFDIGTNAFSLGINDKGVIVGYYSDDNAQHGFLRAPDGTITSFDPPGCTDTSALSIDAKGDVTGYCSSGGAVVGFLRSASGEFTLFNPPGSAGTQPAGIARIGAGTAIAGSYSDGGGVCHGFLRTN